MSPDADRLHEELAEYALPASEQHASRPRDDAEIHTLERLAYRLQASSPLRPDSAFAEQLEQRLQARNAILRQKQSKSHTSARQIISELRQGRRANLTLAAIVVCPLYSQLSQLKLDEQLAGTIVLEHLGDTVSPDTKSGIRSTSRFSRGRKSIYLWHIFSK